MRFFGEIRKVDAEQRLVSGYASTEAKDAQGEVVLKSAIKDALEGYLAFPALRLMHSLNAVGSVEEAEVDGKGLYITAKVTDDDAWRKVKERTLRGFSIGGKALARDPTRKHIITKLRMDEVSLVDRPANEEARIDVVKAAASPTLDVSMVRAAFDAMPADQKALALMKATHRLLGREITARA